MYVLKVHSHYSMNQYLVTFYGWVISLNVYMFSILNLSAWTRMYIWLRHNAALLLHLSFYNCLSCVCCKSSKTDSHSPWITGSSRNSRGSEVPLSRWTVLKDSLQFATNNSPIIHQRRYIPIQIFLSMFNIFSSMFNIVKILYFYFINNWNMNSREKKNEHINLNGYRKLIKIFN